MIVAISNQKGGVGKTTTTANLGVLLARDGRQVLLVDADPQFALTRQLGIEERSLGVNLVDVLAGRAGAEDAIVTGVHGVDVIASGRDLAGIELSLVGRSGASGSSATRATLRLLDPPMQLQPIHQLMLWTPRSEDDPGHRWLRRRLITLAQELTGPAQRLAAADQKQASAAHGVPFVAA
jgi:hypothetical protein